MCAEEMVKYNFRGKSFISKGIFKDVGKYEKVWLTAAAYKEKARTRNGNLIRLNKFAVENISGIYELPLK